MTKREIVRQALDGKTVPYVPWHLGFTIEAKKKLVRHYQTEELDDLIDQHVIWFNSRPRSHFWTDLGSDRLQDYFGVIWDRSRDKDIGVVENLVLPEPTLKNYQFPDPVASFFFEAISPAITQRPDLFRLYPMGFSLYERAWTLRGMENLMMDFYENPNFVHELLDGIADFNIAQLRKVLTFDIDAVIFGDDWGSQRGLQMGPELWRIFIKPRLERMYAEVRKAGKFVFIHSCGDVDELFDELIEMGVDCFNPFQPEVMDVEALMKSYKGRLAFNGGLSTQKTLPYGSTAEVRAEVRRLLELGRDGGLIFGPAHAIEGDVPLENMVAVIEELHRQNHTVLVS